MSLLFYFHSRLWVILFIHCMRQHVALRAYSSVMRLLLSELCTSISVSSKLTLSFAIYLKTHTSTIMVWKISGSLLINHHVNYFKEAQEINSRRFSICSFIMLTIYSKNICVVQQYKQYNSIISHIAVIQYGTMVLKTFTLLPSVMPS